MDSYPHLLDSDPPLTCFTYLLAFTNRQVWRSLVRLLTLPVEVAGRIEVSCIAPSAILPLNASEVTAARPPYRHPCVSINSLVLCRASEGGAATGGEDGPRGMNLAAKLMEKMGWRGGGLGKTQQVRSSRPYKNLTIW